MSRKHFVSFKMRGKVQEGLVKQNGGTYDPSFLAFFTIKADAYTSLYVSPATRYVVQLSSASQVFFHGVDFRQVLLPQIKKSGDLPQQDNDSPCNERMQSVSRCTSWWVEGIRRPPCP